MNPQSNLDLAGDFRLHPFAELLVEILHGKLTGALRLESGTKKIIVYFRDGSVVFAVSNAREHRLFARLLNARIVTQAELKKVKNFSSDMDLASGLCSNGVLTKESATDAFVSQIGDIIVDALTWPDGLWVFSPLARLRADVFFKIEIYQLLTDYARCLPPATVAQRFRSVQERFVRSIETLNTPRLHPQEASILELFGEVPVDFAELRSKMQITDEALSQSLYTLWLGGIIMRLSWNKAFTEARIADIKKTRYARIKEALPIATLETMLPEPPVEQPPIAESETVPSEVVLVTASEPSITLEDWLARAEMAPTHYDLLDVAEDAAADAIKAAYFSLAKEFHPDRFHREIGTQLRRIQVAFTGLAQAYETLKSDETRKSYDYKIRKELEAREKRREAGVADSSDGMQSEHALESFELGLTHFSDDEYGAAAVYLARAVHYNPNNALYRAYHGRALSFDDTQLHKAESELLAAAKLEPMNAKIRIMLARFFIDRNLLKRAEGELKRFLEIAPDNTEAQGLLAGLQ